VDKSNEVKTSKEKVRAEIGWSFWLWWVLASAVSFAAHLVVLPDEEGVVPSAVVLAVLGAVIGVAQWVVLRGRVQKAGWWVLASAVGYAAALLGAGVVSAVVDDVVGAGERVGLCCGFAVGGAMYGTITGAALAGLLRRPAPIPKRETWLSFLLERSALQIVSFIVLAGILYVFVWHAYYYYIAYKLYVADSPLVTILNAAIPIVVGGLAAYATWRRIWDVSHKKGIVVGHLMAILLALWSSGAAALMAIVGLLVYISPIRGVKKLVLVQTAVAFLAVVALGLGWDGAFALLVALGLYVIWLYVLVPLVETALT